MDRVTRDMVEKQLQNFCDSIGEETGRSYNQWYLEKVNSYYRVVKVLADSLGEECPLGYSSHSLREMFEILYAMNNFTWWKVGKECLVKYTASLQSKS